MEELPAATERQPAKQAGAGVKGEEGGEPQRPASPLPGVPIHSKCVTIQS